MENSQGDFAGATFLINVGFLASPFFADRREGSGQDLVPDHRQTLSRQPQIEDDLTAKRFVPGQQGLGQPLTGARQDPLGFPACRRQPQ